MKRQLSRLFGGEKGQAMPEYALIIALISVALIAGLTFLSDRISGLFSHVGSLL